MAYLQEHHHFSQRRACRLLACHRATVRYRPRPTEQEAVRQRLRTLAAERPRFGYRRLTVLLRREYGAVNHKRVYWLYRAEGLAVRRRQRKRVARAARLAPAAPQRKVTSASCARQPMAAAHRLIWANICANMRVRREVGNGRKGGRVIVDPGRP